MKQNKYLLIFSLFCSLVAMFFVFSHKLKVHYVNDPVAQVLMTVINHPVKVSQIHVIHGHEFDLTLEDQRRIHALLVIKTPIEAKSRVLELLNKSSNPCVVLKEKKDDVWVVDLYVTTKDIENNQVEVDLTTWLRDKKLVFE